MAPSRTEGVVGDASGGTGTVRAPQLPAINADGKLDVAELVADRPAALSPFGDDVEFPLPVDGISYNHPSPGKDDKPGAH
jgi:succinate dehydrogenase / fumarate reductase iron-sulfur subunit